MDKETRILLALLLAVVVAGAIPRAVSGSVAVTDAAYQPSEIEAAKESIALSLMGQLQMSVGDLMWLKSMEYLHRGVVQRMPTHGEESEGYTRREATDAAVGMGHTEGLNMVPDKNRDWRGVLGDIHRHTSAYQEGHGHDNPTEIIPWYQLAVRLNPRLERLYTLGSFYLSDFAQDPAEARDLLVAGLKANPESFEINAALGRLYVEYATRLDDLIHEEQRGTPAEAAAKAGGLMPATEQDAYKVAVSVLEKAVERALELKLVLRDRREVFDEVQEQVNGEAYLFLAKAHPALAQYDHALAVCDEGIEFTRNNLLRAQRRVAERLKNGETAEPVS